MITIRPYRNEDFAEIQSWWAAAGEVAPLPGMMPEESSFIAEIDGVPALAVAIYLTNTPELAYIENLIGNPILKGPDRQQAMKFLVGHFCQFAKSHGHKRLLCMTEKDKLVSRYSELGFSPTLGGVTTLVRSL